MKMGRKKRNEGKNPIESSAQSMRKIVYIEKEYPFSMEVVVTVDSRCLYFNSI